MGAPVIIPNDKIIKLMSPAQRKELGLKTREEIDAKIEAKNEAQIQAEVEAWLKIHGFWPRTPAFLDGKTPPAGWFVHLHETRRNAYVLDLIIMTLDGRCLELELKTSTGKVRPEQKVILDTTLCAKVARSTMEAISIIKEWLSKGE